MSCLFFSSGCNRRERVNSVSVAPVMSHEVGFTPAPLNSTANRTGRLTWAALAWLTAGDMMSSVGRASEAPRPRKKVRRGMR